MDRCAECGSNQVAGVEIRGVYDGVLFWSCLSCNFAWPRWTERDPLSIASMDAAARHNRGRGSWRLGE